MIGIVDVGGGNRDIYGAGILDYCIDHNIEADYFVGVSAGSANGVSYIAKQRKRNYRFYSEYSFRGKYMGIMQFLLHGSFVNLDYIYSTLSNSDGEDPVDYEALMKSKTDLEIVATDADTGKSVYFKKADMKKDKYDFLKASSCVPIACKPYEINGKKYYDGGISDPIPFYKAFEAGCDKVIIILTKPKYLPRKNNKDVKLSKYIEKKYPKASERLQTRASVYNHSLNEALRLEKEGKVLILSPNEMAKDHTFLKDVEQLDLLYSKGYYDARMIKQFIEK